MYQSSKKYFYIKSYTKQLKSIHFLAHNVYLIQLFKFFFGSWKGNKVIPLLGQKSPCLCQKM